MANSGISLPRISASEIDIKSIREGSYLLFYNLDNGDALSSINHKGEVIVSQNIPFATASGEFTKLAENGTETITVYTDGTPKLVFLTSALETVSLVVTPETETAPGFIVGELITGDTSGASGILITGIDGKAVPVGNIGEGVRIGGGLILIPISGDFVTGETLIGATSGTTIVTDFSGQYPTYWYYSNEGKSDGTTNTISLGSSSAATLISPVRLNDISIAMFDPFGVYGTDGVATFGCIGRAYDFNELGFKIDFTQFDSGYDFKVKWIAIL
jgi:hypothetical protein